MCLLIRFISPTIISIITSIHQINLQSLTRGCHQKYSRLAIFIIIFKSITYHFVFTKNLCYTSKTLFINSFSEFRLSKPYLVKSRNEGAATYG